MNKKTNMIGNKKDIEENLLDDQSEEGQTEFASEEKEEETLGGECIKLVLPSGFSCELTSNSYTIYSLADLMVAIHKHFDENNNGKKKGKPRYTG